MEPSYGVFKQRMFDRARRKDNVVHAAAALVHMWESPDVWGRFGELEDALIIAVHDYEASRR
jgi:hypothetical protein